MARKTEAAGAKVAAESEAQAAAGVFCQCCGRGMDGGGGRRDRREAAQDKEVAPAAARTAREAKAALEAVLATPVEEAARCTRLLEAAHCVEGSVLGLRIAARG